MSEPQLNEIPGRRQRLLWGVLTVALAVPVGTATAHQWLPALRTQVAGSSATGLPPATALALPGAEVPTLPSPHLARLGAPHAEYNSVPPTSGPHLAWTIAPGVYGEAVPDELAVHALEHGHVVVRYAPSTSVAEVELLAGIARRYPRDVVVAPYPQLADGVALTAWGRIQLLSRVDTTGVEAFVSVLRGRYNHGWARDWGSDLGPASASADHSRAGVTPEDLSWSGAGVHRCTVTCPDGSCGGC